MRLAYVALLGAALLKAQAFSQADLQHWLTVWQHKQQLQDWAIDIKAAGKRDLGSGNVGEVRLRGKRAWITVLDAQDLANVSGQNLRTFTELTIAHELVHVSLAPLQGKGEDTPAADSVVEDIAEALVFGRVPSCATPRDFMEAEIVSLPWKPVDARIREQIIRKLTAAFLDGRPNWTAQHAEACAMTIKTFFARSGWR